MVKISFVFEDGTEVQTQREAIEVAEKKNTRYEQKYTEITVSKIAGAPDEEGPVDKRLRSLVAERGYLALFKGYIALLNPKEIDKLYDAEKKYQIAAIDFNAKDLHFTADEINSNIENIKKAVDYNHKLMLNAHNAIYGSEKDFEDFINSLAKDAKQRAKTNIKNYVIPADSDPNLVEMFKQSYADAENEFAEKTASDLNLYWSRIRKMAAKPRSKSKVKPDTDSKSKVKSDTNTKTKVKPGTDTKSDSKSKEKTKTPAKKEAKIAAKPATKPITKSTAKSTTKPATKTSAKTSSKKTTKTPVKKTAKTKK